jgi:hypothetical protein
MPNNTAFTVEIEEIEEQDDMSADDYGFIIGPDGELKSVMFPEHLMEDPPEEIKIILQLFGIENLEEIESRTLH